MFIDSHCHLNNERLLNQLDDVLARADQAEVKRMVCVSWDFASSATAVLLSQRPQIFASIGVHPESGAEWTPEIEQALADLYTASKSRIVAYGEIGLDYHWETVDRIHQREVFLQQLQFAERLRPDLPVIVHCREAYDDTIATLREANVSNPIIMHCFTEGTAICKKVLDAGCIIGIGGVVTYKKSHELREAAAMIPSDRMLIETDCPYLPPQPMRGKTNEPSFIPIIAETLAGIRGVSVDALATETTANANRIFNFTT